MAQVSAETMKSMSKPDDVASAGAMRPGIPEGFTLFG